MYYLIGLLFALVCGTLILVTLVPMIGSGADNAKAQLMMSELNQMAQSVRAMYASQPGYCYGGTQPSLAQLLAAGSVPPEMVSAGTVYDPWGGSMWIGGSGVWQNANGVCEGFQINVYNVSQQGCVDLGTAGLSSPLPADGQSWQSTYVNGWYGTGSEVPDPAWVAGQCTAGNSNLLAFRFR